MLSCKKITELCSRELERRLNLGERAALRAHLVDVRGLREFSQTAAGAARLGPHLCPWQCAAARRSHNRLRDGRPGQLSLRARSHFSAMRRWPVLERNAESTPFATGKQQSMQPVALLRAAWGEARDRGSRWGLSTFITPRHWAIRHDVWASGCQYACGGRSAREFPVWGSSQTSILGHEETLQTLNRLLQIGRVVRTAAMHFCHAIDSWWPETPTRTPCDSA